MPNHTSNHLYIAGPEETLRKILDRHFVKDETGVPTTLCLQSVDPMPDILDSDIVQDLHQMGNAALDVTFGTALFRFFSSSSAPGETGDLPVRSLDDFLALLEQYFPERYQEVISCQEKLREMGLTGTYWYPWRVGHWGTKWDAYGGDVDLFVRAHEPVIVASYFTAWSPPDNALVTLSEMYPDCQIENFALDEGGCFATKDTFINGYHDSESFDWQTLAEEEFGFEFDRDDENDGSGGTPGTAHRDLILPE